MSTRGISPTSNGGTKSPVTLRDPEFGPIRLRAFETYVVRVADPARFLKEVVRDQWALTLNKVFDQLKNLIVTRFSDLLGGCKIPVLYPLSRGTIVTQSDCS